MKADGLGSLLIVGIRYRISHNSIMTCLSQDIYTHTPIPHTYIRTTYIHTESHINTCMCIDFYTPHTSISHIHMSIRTFTRHICLYRTHTFMPRTNRISHKHTYVYRHLHTYIHTTPIYIPPTYIHTTYIQNSPYTHVCV